MELQEYQKYVKDQRGNYFDSPYDLVYRVFVESGFDRQPEEFFLQNASMVVETLRAGCWETYTPLEKAFMSEMLCVLIDELSLDDMSPRDAIVKFSEEYPEHIYQLSLSNTQSRRSRAGKEFETIIELILIGAGIPMDTQGNIGKKLFVDKGLGKLVDVVSPGVVQFEIDKNDVVLISAKTTLRERWQEVPEEMSRTGAREMFLATLDENISNEVLETLYESNIRVTTTRAIKNRCYPDNRRVLDFERLLEICKINDRQWNGFDYSDDHLGQIEMNIEAQIEKHRGHNYILEYYYDRLRNLPHNPDRQHD